MNIDKVFGEKLSCVTCDKEHTFDPLGSYECLFLIDGREVPAHIIGWCDEVCFNQWLDSPQAKELFPVM